MSLTRADVEHVAMLARLGLSEDELDTLQEQLSSILGHIDVLNELDTDAIPPTAQVLDLHNVMRADEVEPSLPQDAVMNLTAYTRNGFFAVPAVLGGSDEETTA